MITLIRDAVVITLNPERTVHPCGAVVVEGERIRDVGASAEIAKRWPVVDETIDARRKVVLPGFVSAHNHVGYAVFRGRSEDLGHAPTHRLYLPMSGIIAPAERLDIGCLAIAELLRGGVTCILEMEEGADLFAPFIERCGMRARIGVMVNDLDLDRLAEGRTVFDERRREEQLEQAVGFAHAWHGKAHGRILGVMAATGLSTSSPRLLRGLRDTADRMRIPISIHLGFGEKALVRGVHGKEQLDYARENGMLERDVIAVHGYDVDQDEIETLAASGIQLAHCPLMNQFRGEIAPVEAYRARGMNVGLGIDNFFSDFFDLLRACIAGARIRAHDPEVMQADEALELATIGSARALGLESEIGSLEPGKRADLQIVDMRRFGLTPVNDALRTLVYHGHAKDVDTVMVDGRLVVRGGRMVEVDEETLIDAADAASEAAWARFAARHGGYAAPAPG
jgi:cytosine/adenosine deaminase-related metal-dependent hydrolase